MIPSTKYMKNGTKEKCESTWVTRYREYMQLRLPNTPINRGASEQIYSRAYMAVCASVCVCGVWTAIEGTARPTPDPLLLN